MYYMLNLVFNYLDNKTAPNGRFVDFVNPGPNPTTLLLTSKAWLESLATAPNPPDPNNTAHWQFAQRDKQHLSFGATAQPTLWVRIVDANQGPNEDYMAQITVVMGRNDQKRAPQAMSSPIQNFESVTGPLCVWNTAGYIKAQTTNGGSIASWKVTLGQATLVSGASGTQNNYIFLAAAVVLGSPTRTFSHDPDMDINC